MKSKWIAPVILLGGAGLVGFAMWLSPRPGVLSMSCSPLNDRIVAEANRQVGIGANTNLPEFEDLLGGPGEDKNTELQMATWPKTSTCGLVVGGIWRRAGVKHPELDPPYHVGTAISRLVAIAQQHNAWMSDVASYTPQPGDTMMLDVDKPSGHVNTVVGVQATPTGWVLQTVDGGAVDAKGGQITMARTHTLTRQGNSLQSVSSIGVHHNVTGFVDVCKLAPIAVGGDEDTDPYANDDGKVHV